MPWPSDGSGTLDASELQDFAFTIGYSWSDEDCRKVLDTVDKDASGTIDFEVRGGNQSIAAGRLAGHRWATQLMPSSRRPQEFQDWIKTQTEFQQTGLRIDMLGLQATLAARYAQKQFMAAVDNVEVRSRAGCCQSPGHQSLALQRRTNGDAEKF